MTAPFYEGYSQTSASNNSAAPSGAPEGMAPSGLNDTMRQIMAAIAQMRDNKDSEDRNFFVDPCCRVAQDPGATALGTTYKYGAVDLVHCKATGTAVNAGTIVQDSSTTVSTAVTPYSCKIAGATITGTGKVFFRKWIESRDSQALNGQAVIFSVKCRQDTGGSINAFLTLNKFQSQDSAGTPTQLATNSGAVTSVATGTDTIVSLAYTFGASDGANGVELILEMDCGAVTTKNFYATDWQARIGTAVRTCSVPPFQTDLAQVLRYFERSYEYGTAAATTTTNGNISYGNCIATANGATVFELPFRALKIVTPTMTFYSPTTGASAKIRYGGASDIAVTSGSDKSTFAPINNSGGALTANLTALVHFVADARL